MSSTAWMVGPMLAVQQVLFGFLAIVHVFDDHRWLAVANMAACAFVAFVREARRQ